MSIINSEARARLEAAIDARVATGVKAAAYHTDDEPVVSAFNADGTVVERAAGVGTHRVGCVGDDCDCPVQRPDKVSDKAMADAYAMRAAIETLVTLEAEYEPQHRYKTPGIGPCPRGKCQDCWQAGFEVNAAAKRYANLCRRHGDFRKRNGYPIPTIVTRALKAVDWNWEHWSVRRAQRSA